MWWYVRGIAINDFVHRPPPTRAFMVVRVCVCGGPENIFGGDFMCLGFFPPHKDKKSPMWSFLVIGPLFNKYPGSKRPLLCHLPSSKDHTAFDSGWGKWKGDPEVTSYISFLGQQEARACPFKSLPSTWQHPQCQPWVHRWEGGAWNTWQGGIHYQGPSSSFTKKSGKSDKAQSKLLISP